MIAMFACNNFKVMENFLDLQGVSGEQLKRIAVEHSYICKENLSQNSSACTYMTALSSNLIQLALIIWQNEVIFFPTVSFLGNYC